MRNLDNHDDGFGFIVLAAAFFLIIIVPVSFSTSGEGEGAASTTSVASAPMPAEHPFGPSPAQETKPQVVTFDPIAEGGTLWDTVAAYVVAHGAVDHDTAVEVTAATVQSLRDAYPDRNLDEVYPGESFALTLSS